MTFPKNLPLSLSLKPVIALLVLLSVPTIYLIQRARQTALSIHVSHPVAALTVTTLIFGPQTEDHVNIAHNCRVISPTQHDFIVYTQNTSLPYCAVCKCIQFVPRKCKCPLRSCGLKHFCEKIYLLVDLIRTYEEFVFIDNDLLILRDDFLPHLATRALAHDFLATYRHAGMNERRHKFMDSFNSGLFFIRRKQGLQYENMIDLMYEGELNNDQPFLSAFVQKHYANWDTLSWRWHCRYLERMKQDIPVEYCYTVHGRTHLDDALRKLNRTRLSIP